MKIFAALLFVVGALCAGLAAYVGNSSRVQTVQMVKVRADADAELIDDAYVEVGSPIKALITQRDALLNDGKPNEAGHLLWDASKGRPADLTTLRVGMGAMTVILWVLAIASWLIAARVSPRGTSSGQVEALVDLDNDETVI